MAVSKTLCNPILLAALVANFPGTGTTAETIVKETAAASLEEPSRPRVRQDPPAAGMFLVAGTKLLDPNFAETVVLLVDYNEDGALGVIVNRPTETLVEEILPDLEGVAGHSRNVWIGGPVAQWQLVMLARSETDLTNGTLVMKDLYFSSSRSALERVVADQGEYRLYAGYAGWSPGQLDQEIKRGGWRVMPAEVSMVFDSAPLDLWRELIQQSTIHWAGLSRSSSQSEIGDPIR